MGFGLVGLYIKGTLTGELFAVSRNGLALGGTDSLSTVSESPDVKAS